MNDWKYDTSCMFTSLPVSDFEHFKRLIFVAQLTTLTGNVVYTWCFWDQGFFYRSKNDRKLPWLKVISSKSLGPV
jgi:hypothetical protein